MSRRINRISALLLALCLGLSGCVGGKRELPDNLFILRIKELTGDRYQATLVMELERENGKPLPGDAQLDFLEFAFSVNTHYSGMGETREGKLLLTAQLEDSEGKLPGQAGRVTAGNIRGAGETVVGLWELPVTLELPSESRYYSFSSADFNTPGVDPVAELSSYSLRLQGLRERIRPGEYSSSSWEENAWPMGLTLKDGRYLELSYRGTSETTQNAPEDMAWFTVLWKSPETLDPENIAGLRFEGRDIPLSPLPDYQPPKREEEWIPAPAPPISAEQKAISIALDSVEGDWRSAYLHLRLTREDGLDFPEEVFAGKTDLRLDNSGDEGSLGYGICGEARDPDDPSSLLLIMSVQSTNSLSGRSGRVVVEDLYLGNKMFQGVWEAEFTLGEAERPKSFAVGAPESGQTDYLAEQVEIGRYSLFLLLATPDGDARDFFSQRITLGLRLRDGSTWAGSEGSMSTSGEDEAIECLELSRQPIPLDEIEALLINDVAYPLTEQAG